MADRCVQDQGIGDWNPWFSRFFNDRELHKCASYSPTIQKQKVYPGEKDRLVRNQSKDGCFSIKSLYGVMEGMREGIFPRNMVGARLPTKVSFFAWKVWWCKILTVDQLKKRVRHLANRRLRYGEDEENFDFLLLDYRQAGELWTFLFAIFGINWVLPCSAREAFLVGKTLL